MIVSVWNRLQRLLVSVGEALFRVEPPPSKSGKALYRQVRCLQRCTQLLGILGGRGGANIVDINSGLHERMNNTNLIFVEGFKPAGNETSQKEIAQRVALDNAV